MPCRIIWACLCTHLACAPRWRQVKFEASSIFPSGSSGRMGRRFPGSPSRISLRDGKRWTVHSQTTTCSPMTIFCRTAGAMSEEFDGPCFEREHLQAVISLGSLSSQRASMCPNDLRRTSRRPGARATPFARWSQPNVLASVRCASVRVRCRGPVRYLPRNNPETPAGTETRRVPMARRIHTVSERYARDSPIQISAGTS